jgi:hypothetical protein
MSQDVIRIQLTADQRSTVEAQTGVELDELAYPDPGGELSARFPDLPTDDVLNWALAQAMVIAYENDRVAAQEALDERERSADEENDRARVEIQDCQRRAVEEKARMLEEATPDKKKKRKRSRKK